MTPLAEKLPTMSDADLKALRLNAVRLSESGSPTKMATAAELVPLIDEEVARLHLARIGVKLTQLRTDQADYIGVKPEGPFKAEHYRY